MCDGSHPGRVRRRLGGDLLVVVVDFPGNTIDKGVEVKERKAKQQQQEEGE